MERHSECINGRVVYVDETTSSKVVHFEDERGAMRRAILREEWLATSICAEDEVCLVQTTACIDSDEINVRDSNTWLIVNPGKRVTVTSIAAAEFCKRKTVLASKYKAMQGTIIIKNEKLKW